MTETDDRLDDIEARLDRLEQENERLRDENDQLQERVDQLEKENNRLNQQLDQHAADVAELDDRALAEDQKKTIFGDLATLKDRIDGSNPTHEAEDIGYSGSEIAETPLEQVVAMPDEMAAESLTPNQQRARHIASNIRDYASDTPKGRMMRSQELRTVLSARFDVSHSQTIERVREFLRDLGDDHVECNEKTSAKAEYQTGEKRLVFDESLVRRLDRIADESGGTDHGVVTG